MATPFAASPALQFESQHTVLETEDVTPERDNVRGRENGTAALQECARTDHGVNPEACFAAQSLGADVQVIQTPLGIFCMVNQ
jgi:hypothetical protein